MNVLSKDEFLSRKNSDTIVIYGCGYSINRLTADDRTILCDAVINNKTVEEKLSKYQISLHFLDIDNATRDIIHSYGMESWRE